MPRAASSHGSRAALGGGVVGTWRSRFSLARRAFIADRRRAFARRFRSLLDLGLGCRIHLEPCSYELDCVLQFGVDVTYPYGFCCLGQPVGQRRARRLVVGGGRHRFLPASVRPLVPRYRFCPDLGVVFSVDTCVALEQPVPTCRARVVGDFVHHEQRCPDAMAFAGADMPDFGRHGRASQSHAWLRSPLGTPAASVTSQWRLVCPGVGASRCLVVVRCGPPRLLRTGRQPRRSGSVGLRPNGSRFSFRRLSPDFSGVLQARAVAASPLPTVLKARA